MPSVTRRQSSRLASMPRSAWKSAVHATATARYPDPVPIARVPALRRPPGERPMVLRAASVLVCLMLSACASTPPLERRAAVLDYLYPPGSAPAPATDVAL